MESSSYHNTTGATGALLEEHIAKAKGQERKVLKFFADHPTELFTPEDIQQRVLMAAPLTSARRAITNLTGRRLLEKTPLQREGRYGRAVHRWRLAPRLREGGI